MRFLHVIPAVAAGVVFCASARAQVIQQLPIPYNADVIREVGGTISQGVEPNTRRAFVTQGEAALHDTVDPRGLPDDGVFSMPGGTIQFGPYAGNNGYIMTNGTPGLGFGLPVGAPRPHTYHVFGTAAGGGNPFGPPSMTVRHSRFGSDGLSVGPTTLWEDDPAGVRYLIDGLDRTSAVGDGFEDVDDVAIFHLRIPVFPEDTALEGVSFTISGPGAFVVLAQAVEYVPEPSGAAAVLLFGLLLRRRSFERGGGGRGTVTG
jgi:hypothetical protein